MTPFKRFGRGITNRSFLSESWQHCLVVSILFLFSQTLCAKEWIRISGPEVEVYTDAGPAVAQQTLARIQMLASVFAEFGRIPHTSRLQVLVFASEADFDTYKPSAISAGFYQTGAEGDWIVFPARVGDRVALHEYAHLLLNRGTIRLPQWLEEGLAEFFSTVRVTGTDRIQFGLPIAEHVRNFQYLSPMTDRELLLASKKSIHYENVTEAGRFYATSWALVHMLYFDPLFSRHMPEFVDAIDKAASEPEAAFQRAFGMSLEKALIRIPHYLQAIQIPSRTIKADLSSGGGQAQSTLKPPQPVAPFEILRIQAELLLDSGKRSAASRKYREIARLAPSSLGASEAMAFLALAENDTTLALSRLAAIAEKPDASARAVFEYAMLLRDSAAGSGRQSAEERRRVTALLERTVQLDPNYAEAQFLLGVRATDEKRYGEAVERLRQATALMPRQFSFWHALAYAQAKMKNIAEASISARKASRMAESAEEEQMAKGLFGLLGVDGSPLETAQAKPKVHVPQSWNNTVGDQTIAGTLMAFVCAADHPRIQIRTQNGKIEEFPILDARNLTIRPTGNGSESHQMEFACGRLEPRPVKLQYLNSSRSITLIEFLP